MEEGQVKHLEMIQAVVTRLAQNSFGYKGWAITLVTGTLALAAAEGMPRFLVLVALVPIVVFWGLDGYYLRQERLFRKLYDAVRTAELVDWEESRFTMDTRPFAANIDAWLQVCRSRTILGLYAPLTGIVVFLSLVLGR